jgi:hypothetical protein
MLQIGDRGPEHGLEHKRCKQQPESGTNRRAGRCQLATGRPERFNGKNK